MVSILNVLRLIRRSPSLIVEAMLSRVLLMTVMKLVAYALIVHLCKNDLLKAIVVTTDLNLICHHVFYSVVMPHDLHLANHALLSLRMVSFGVHLVVVASDEQVRDSVACADLDLAVVTSEDDAVSRFHDGHRN